MAALQNKVDFVALIRVKMANSNGDPLDGNRPRTDMDGFGEISDVCIKRKLRNRMQDMGHPVFVQSQERSQDGFGSLKERAEAVVGKEKSETAYAKKACDAWLDVRAFGQVFAFKGGKDDAVSVGVRGPVSVHQAVSVAPVDIVSMQITKSVNGEPGEKRGSDTMGTKHLVRYGLYVLKGSINVQLAEKTGFSQEDAQVLKECLRTLFRNDASSARPEGSMEVIKLYWFEHNCKDGQYSSAKVHRSVHIEQPDPTGEAYQVTLDPLPGLVPEEIDGE